MIKGRYVRGGHYTEVILNGDVIGGRKRMIPRFMNTDNYIDMLNDELSIAQERWNTTNSEIDLREIETLNKVIIIARAQPQIEASMVKKSCETCRHRRKSWKEEPCSSCKFVFDDGTEWESMKGKWRYVGLLRYQCSECGCKLDRTSAFCPDCGSPMEVEQ